MSYGFCCLHTLRLPLGGQTSCNRSGAEKLLGGNGFTMAAVRAGCILPYKVGHFFSNKTPLVNADMVELQEKLQGLSTFCVVGSTHVMSPWRWKWKGTDFLYRKASCYKKNNSRQSPSPETQDLYSPLPLVASACHLPLYVRLKGANVSSTER
jgi:hypothetical protein